MNPENTREKKVEQMFAQNPEVATVFVTADDFGFTAESRADSHAQSLKDRTIETFTRDQFFPTEPAEAAEGDDLLALSVPKLIKAISDVSDVEALQALKATEEAKGDAARKTAVEAIQARIDVLVAEIEVTE